MFFSGRPLGARYLSVLYLCRLRNVLTHLHANVSFNWRQPATSTAGSQQQAVCVVRG